MTKVRELKVVGEQESRSSVPAGELEERCAKIQAEQNRATEEVLELKEKLSEAEAGRGDAAKVAAQAKQAQTRLQKQVDDLTKKLEEANRAEKTTSVSATTASPSPSKGLHLELRKLQEKDVQSQHEIQELERKLNKVHEEMGTMIKATREARIKAENVESAPDARGETHLMEQLAAEKNISGGLRGQVAEMRRNLLSGQEARMAQAGRLETSVEPGVDREIEMQRLAGEITRLNTTLRSKDTIITDLTMRLSEKHTSSGPEGLDKLDSGFASLAARQDQLDSDMQLMEENLLLQASVAERDEEIAQLRSRLLNSRKPSVNEILFQ